MPFLEVPCSCSFYNVWAFMPVDIIGRYFSSLLGVLAQRQGAHAVLATLRQVADTSTAQLMGEFFRQRLQGNAITKAQTLQQAQLALLNGNTQSQNATASASPGATMDASQEDNRSLPQPKPATNPSTAADPNRPWAHPFFWAPFVLMGNWL